MFQQFSPYLFAGLFLIACSNSENIAEPEDLSSSSISSSSQKDSEKSSSSECEDCEKVSSSSEKSSSSQSIYDAENNTLTDLRDGQTYRTTTIGTQVWMAENLNYETEGSYCLHDKAESCSKYGRLYTWGAAMDSAGLFSDNSRGCGYTKTCTITYPARGVCPEGWHIPTNNEFYDLFWINGKYGEPSTTKEIAYRLRSETGWEGGAYSSNEFGFSALPAGIRHVDTYRTEETTAFWTSLEYQKNAEARKYFAYYRMINLETAHEDFAYGKLSALSVRCIKDEPSGSGNPDTTSSSSESSTSKPLHVSKGTMMDSRDGQTYRTLTINEQTWMAENLNYKTKASFCNDSCDKYGLLYSWKDALTTACPTGWRLPTSAEFNELIDAVGGQKTAGAALKSASGWNDNEAEIYRDENGCSKYYSGPEDHNYYGETCINEYEPSWNGIDAIGFTVLPAGDAVPQDSFLHPYYQGSRAVFFTSTQGHNITFFYNNTEIREGTGQSPSKRYYSIRCIKADSSTVPDKADSSTVPDDAKGSMIDPRDGQSYSTVKIGEQTWMAENLNYETENSCCYNDSSAYCEKYGRLYAWDAAVEACPSGWHLPSESEFKALLSSVDKSKSAKELKTTTGWYDDGENGNGTDKYGFSALPSGYKNFASFSNLGGITVFWSSTEDGSKKALSLSFYYNEDKAFVSSWQRQIDYGYSVRCLKD